MDISNDSELTVEEMIRCGLDAAIETVCEDSDDDEGCRLFRQSCHQLTLLLKRLVRGEILPARAEFEMWRIEEVLGKWTQDNPPPPD